jgi:hypothetical protein
MGRVTEAICNDREDNTSGLEGGGPCRTDEQVEARARAGNRPVLGIEGISFST